MLYALFLSLILTAAAFGQASLKKPATPRGKGSAVSKANRLVSEKGRFSIGLPEKSGTFEEATPSAEAPKASGGKYTWDLAQGVVTIDYADDPDLVIKTKQDYADVEEGLSGGVAAFGGTVVSKKPFNVGRYRGYQVEFRDPEKLTGFTRILVVDGRNYTLFGLVRNKSAVSRAFISNALDSFRLTPTK